MSLLTTFLEHVDARPDATALITPQGERIGYAQLDARSSARARAWAKAGIGAGDIVLVARGVSPELYETLLALFRLGAVAMFPEPAAGLKGLAVAVEMARPKAMAAGWLGRALRLVNPSLGGLQLLPEQGDGTGPAPLAVLPPSAPALVTFTSGSTGRPKGIVRSSEFLMLQHTLLEHLRRTQPDHVDLISLPVFILSNLAAGAASVIPAGKLTRPAKLDGARLRNQMVQHGVTRIIAPPAVCARIAADAEQMNYLTDIFTGGGPVFPNLIRDLTRGAPRAAIHAVYGSTEAEPIAHLTHTEISSADWSAMAEGKGLLAGHPISEISVELRDHEVVVSGPHVNEGYLDPADNASTKSVENGVVWHRTGDAARRDEQGRLWLLGRREAARDGLFPFAVETAALTWPGVRQAALLAGRYGTRLAVTGASLDMADLQRRADHLGDMRVVELRAIPLDKRHNSKTDYTALKRMMRGVSR